MIIGNELRDARERLGLSREQISAATKIELRKVAALEEDAFDRLPTGIYLHGMAAAYAREVGLDADALVRRLRVHVGTPPAASLEEIAAVRQSHVDHVPELRFGLAHGMLAFAVVALLLAVLGVGVQFYPLQPATEPQQTVAAAARPDRIAPRIARELPETLPAEIGTTGVGPAAEAAEPPAVAAPIAVDEGAVPQPAVAEPAPLPVPPPAAPAGDPVRLVAVSDVAGAWTFETLVESSSLRTFEGLRLGYRLELRQKGSRIEGTGRKISENGVALGGRRQTPIAVNGVIDGGRLRLTFGEEGARRRSTGTFDLVAEDSGVLRGSFSSNAARSAGVVEARRL